MIRYVVVLPRRVDISAAEFRRRWIDEHGPLAASLPGLIRGELLPSVDPDAGYGGVGILYFEDVESLDRALASDEARRLRDHTATFADSDDAIRVVVSDRDGSGFG